MLSTRVLLPALGDAQTVLSTAIDPPPASRVALALQNLAVNGALFDVNGSSAATVLGRFSSLLPVGITGAKMVLLGLALGCETDAIVIATAFSQPLGRWTTSWFFVSHRVRRSKAASSHKRDPVRCSSVQCSYGAAP